MAADLRPPETAASYRSQIGGLTGAPVWICRRPRASWQELWPRFRHYDDAGAEE